MATNDIATANENDEASNIDVLANDDNAESAIIAVLNGLDVSAGDVIELLSGALVTVYADGTVDYNPNGAFETLSLGETITDSFFYQTLGFVPQFSLSDLLSENGGDGSAGFVINGIDSADFSGRSVSSAGDVNGDGIDDLIIGAASGSPNGVGGAGESYVVFGSEDGFAASLDLSSLDGSNGFVLNGISNVSNSGFSVSGAGDVNGDGIDDVIIGAPRGNGIGRFSAGEAYVVFGSDQGFAASVDIGSANRFSFFGNDTTDYAGTSVSSAGDVNGDGIDDFLIGARGGDLSPAFDAGETYVVFGNSQGLGSSLNVASLNGSNGFTVFGVGAGDRTGTSVSAAGDVNGDGFADIIIGARYADPDGRSDAGASYVVFGSDQPFSTSLNLSALDGSNGFVINGVDAGDESGWSVSSAGDVNGDGIDDLLIGARDAGGSNGDRAGETFVVFGSDIGFGESLELSSLDGSNGFVINGVDNQDYSGSSVSSAGDINGDGIEDIIIGAFNANVDGTTRAGESYVVFGSDRGFAANLDLSDLDGSNGFVIRGIDTFDQSGVSVSGAGDINGDGVDDLIIGADGADPNGNSLAGQSYVVFGSTDIAQQFSNTATVTVTITGENDAPVVAGPVDLGASDEDAARIITAAELLANASDVDASDILSVENLFASSGALIDNLDGTWSFTPAADDDSEVTFTFDVSDGTASVSTSAVLDLTPVADAPVANEDTGSASEDGPAVTIDLLGNDDNAPGAVIGTLNGAAVSAGDVIELASGALVTINADGAVDYDPNGAFEDLADGEQTTDSFDYQALIPRQGFGSEFNLSGLLTANGGDGSAGLIINGIDASDLSGRSVSSAGDVNGDGIDDLIIGAPFGDPNGNVSAGESYVVFGSDQGFGASLDLSSLDGSNGFIINGIDAFDQSGRSVSSAGDVNGDGVDDLIIGAYGADPNGNLSAGESYVVFGSDQAFNASLDLSSLDGSNGFVINGIDASDQSGRSVSSAGDVNGDGIDDIIIGSPVGRNGAGETYVVFGSDQAFFASLDLSSLDGSNGFVINGIKPTTTIFGNTFRGDFSGWSVSLAGDVNGDGIDDIIIGAREADPNGNSSAGESYVVFGSTQAFSPSLNLSSLDGSNGFIINGIDTSDFSGGSVSSAGDVNGDGIEDLIIGSYRAGPNGNNQAGESYVVFGSDQAFSASLDLSSLDGSNGFVINGIDANDFSGGSVSSAGDVNGDGIDDLIIGARLASPNGINVAGESYVVFGSDQAFNASLDLSSLDGTNGFVINGIDTNDRSGLSVSSAGDVNGDGIDDLIIGAYFADPNGTGNAGESYVVFGSADIVEQFSNTATVTVTITGENDAPTIGGEAVASVDEGGSVVITTANVVGADVDDDLADLTYTVSNVTNGVVQVSGVDATSFTHAELINGDVTFVHDGSETMSGGFDVVVSDDDGATSDVTPVAVLVTDINDAPVVTGPVDLGASDEDATRIITAAELLANASDVDASDILSVENLAASSGSLEDNLDGTWTFTPAPDDDTEVTFTFDVTDGTASVSTSATLDLTPVNDAPVVSGPVDLGASDEDAARIITAAELLANASDADGDDLSVENLVASSGALIDNLNGTWTFTPAADDDTEVTFTFDVSDGTASVSTSAVLDLTPVGPNLIEGTTDDDVLFGTDASDTMIGNGGRDVFRGSLGDDTIFGTAENYDELSLAGSAADYVFIDNGDGTVTVTGALVGSDILTDIDGVWFRGGQEWSRLEDLLAPETNLIEGTSGDDILTGTDGSDTMIGNGGIDVFRGSLGDDTIIGSSGSYDEFSLEGSAADYIFFENADGTVTAAGAAIGTDILSNIDGVWFRGAQEWSRLEDLLTPEVNLIEGTIGDDILFGTDGSDTMIGNGGRDVFRGSLGDDTLIGTADSYDELSLAGSASDYTFTENSDGTVTVTGDLIGTDTLTEIDGVWFRGAQEWFTIADLFI